MPHASCELTVDFSNSCGDVQTEMKARINGQYNEWHDPHNNGTYAITSSSGNELATSRLTGDKKYTDLQLFTFTSNAQNGCTMTACSQSQVFSIKDFGTNYCNLLVLYANNGNKPVTKALTYSESVGKCTESTPQACWTK